MTRIKRNISLASTTSALAVIALSGTACAQETNDQAYDNQAADTPTYESQATDAQKMDSTADQHMNTANQKTEDAHQMATTFGVGELNDIENWKITNNGQELGEIDRIGVDRATGELLAVVGLEGVTGVNMKEVGVPLQRLKKAGDETLSTDLSKDELQKKRDIDPWDGSYSQVIKEATQ